jgi:oligopeptide/dipeptide ABC transporter ATP-binding protein
VNPEPRTSNLEPRTPNLEPRTSNPEPRTSNPEPLLSVEHLTTVFDTAGGPVPAVDDVSFAIGAGETLGLVGESGSGKSVTALSIMGLVQPPGRIGGGRVRFKGRDLLALGEREMQSVRGAEISLIFQEPMTALNPVFRIGDQIAEALLVHGRATRREARVKAVELLRSVRIPNPESRISDYPHQLSGGLRQRVMIAIALACQPSLVIADEPTTALDVTIQAEILDLLREMKAAFHLALLLITHDLGVVAETADRVAVMYAGRIVETGPVRAIFSTPAHPYTRGLLASIPGGRPGARLQAIDGSVPLLGDLPPGCAFNPRCPDRFEPCTTAPPPDYAVSAEQAAKCYLYADAAAVDPRVHPQLRNPQSATPNPQSALRTPQSDGPR